MSHHWKIRLTLAAAVISIAGAVLAIAIVGRGEEQRISRQLVEGQALDKRGAERDLAPLAALELAVWCLESQNVAPPVIY